MTIECYDSNCPKHCNKEGGEGPFCYEDECIHAENSAATDPYAESVSKAIHDISEARPTELSEVEERLKAAAAEGKWSLIAPDGRAWIGFDLHAIWIVVLSSLGRG